MNRIWVCILVMGAVSFLIRALPLTLIRRQIKSRFIRSMLYYLPYVTLAVMTVPAILHISENPTVGLVALAASALTAWLSKNLFLSAAVACLATLVMSLI